MKHWASLSQLQVEQAEYEPLYLDRGGYRYALSENEIRARVVADEAVPAFAGSPGLTAVRHRPSRVPRVWVFVFGSLRSGITFSGLGWPTRSRALALTALTAEKVFRVFFFAVLGASGSPDFSDHGFSNQGPAGGVSFRRVQRGRDPGKSL